MEKRCSENVKLKSLMKQSILTQEDVGEMLGISSQSVRLKIKGLIHWNIFECKVLCKYFNLSIEELFVKSMIMGGTL